MGLLKYFSVLFFILSMLVFSNDIEKNYCIHEIKKGETIFNIAQSYTIKTKDLMDFNGIKDPTKIFLGQKIKIPKENGKKECRVYKVKNIISSAASVIDEKTQGQNKKDDTKQNLPTTVNPTTNNESKKNDNTQKEPENNKVLEEKKPVENVRIIHKNYIKVEPKVKNMITIVTPVDNPKIDNTFGKDDNVNSSGVVFYSKFRSKIKSAANGRVIYIGDDIKHHGLTIMVMHQNNFVTTYSNLDEASVKVGEYVIANQILGYMGLSGGVSKPQLGFSIRKDGHIAVNPFIFINKKDE